LLCFYIESRPSLQKGRDALKTVGLLGNFSVASNGSVSLTGMILIAAKEVLCYKGRENQGREASVAWVEIAGNAVSLTTYFTVESMHRCC
jgi:hypothetical protein